MTKNFLSHFQAITLLFTLLSAAVFAAAPGKNDKTIILAYTTNMFSSVNTSDAKLAMEIWAKKLAARMGFDYKVDVRIYRDIPSLINAARTRETDFLQLPTPDYLAMKDREILEPLLAGVKHGSPYEAYILLVSKESAIKRIDQLRDKRIIIEKGTKGSLPYIWLDTTLMKQNLPAAEKFFKTIAMEETPSRSILPVYFHQADACLVARGAYETVLELNPAVGKNLVPIKESPGYVFGFLCGHRKADPKMKEAIMESAKSLDKEPEGKQILTLFRMDSVVVIKPEHLKSCEVLLHEYHELLKKNK
jgi:ABC-type phosphate/phosphonate transport system substrate-binding protein